MQRKTSVKSEAESYVRRLALRLVPTLLVALLASHAALANGCSGSGFGGGTGTNVDPFLISTTDHVAYLSDTDSCISGTDLHFQLVNDVDFGDATWATGIGGDGVHFNGTFDGNGYTLSNLNIGGASTDRVGFFDSLLGAEIVDVVLSDVHVTGRDFVGGLAGVASATIIYSTSIDTTIRGTGSGVGGLAGFAQAIVISDVDALVDVESNVVVSSTDIGTGGVVGYVSGTDVLQSIITGVQVGGTVSSTGLAVGGLAGIVVGTPNDPDSVVIHNAHASAIISGSGSGFGGLIGYVLDAVIDSSRASGLIDVYDGDNAVESYGGLIGWAIGSPGTPMFVIDSSASGDLDIVGPGYSVGGLIGDAVDVHVIDSYASGDVFVYGFVAEEFGSFYHGGLVGSAEDSIFDGSYAEGYVDSVGYEVGGFAGMTINTSITDAAAWGDVYTEFSGGVVGGFIGTADEGTFISNSASAGNVFVLDGYDGGGGVLASAGGFAGDAVDAWFEDVGAVGSVQAEGGCVGGLVGFVSATDVRRAFAWGSVLSYDAAEGVGGFGGCIVDGVTIEDAYALGDVEGGQVAGFLASIDGAVTVANAYASGSVTGDTSAKGFLGDVSNTSVVTVTDAFWNVTTSGIGAAGDVVDGAKGITSSTMTNAATFHDAGWSIAPPTALASATWQTCTGGGRYPVLTFLTGATPCESPWSLEIVGGSAPLQHVPFDVVVTHRDLFGDAYAVPRDVTLSVVAAGGEDPLGRLAETASATLAAGEVTVTLEGVTYTGFGTAGEDGEVLLRIESDAYPPFVVPVSVVATALTLETQVDALPADGASETIVTARRVDSQGRPVVDHEIAFQTTLGSFLDADGRDMGSTITQATNLDGEASVRLRSADVVGSTTVTASCSVDCEATVDVAFVSAAVTAPEDLVMIPGNETVWLLFTPSVGSVQRYQYTLDGATTWTDVPADREQPWRIEGTPNGVPVTVQLRAVGPDGPTAATQSVTATPRLVEAPNVTATLNVPSEPVGLTVVDGAARLEVPFTFTNLDDARLQDAWLTFKGFDLDAYDVTVIVESGTLARYQDRWYWPDVQLEPGEVATGTLVLTIEEAP